LQGLDYLSLKATGSLPQFNLGAIGIDQPSELAIGLLLDLTRHLTTRRHDLGDQRVEVIDPKSSA
jgi:hypothetical protein